jgi:hypothetical protein
MLADKAMMTKPVCGDDPSIDDKELAITVDKDKEEPLVVHQSKKMPKRSRRFGWVTRGVPSRSKRQHNNTNINLDVRLDVVSAPINVTIDPPIQDSTVSAGNDTHVPPQANAITQLRRKVHDSTVRNDKLTQLVAELKNEVSKRLYPSRQDLFIMIPQLQALTLAKLANDGMVSMDTCNTACKTRRLLCEAIRTVAIEQGLREESINVMENDCWNHLHNVWFGAVIKELSSHSDEVLKDDLSEIHPILQVTTNPSNILRAIERFLEKLQIMPRDWGQCITTICTHTIPKHIIIK